MSILLKLRQSIGRLHRKWLRRRLRSLRPHLEFSPEDAIFLSGEPRGGTTWLAEIIRRSSPTAVVWEPFTGDKKNPFRKLGIHWRQNIPPDADWPEMSTSLHTMLGGRALDTNSAYYERLRPANYLQADRLLVKCVHANGMLRWIVRQVDFQHAPIYLLRHPFAIVSSQKKHGAWKNVKAPYHLPKGPYDKIFRRHEDFIGGLDTFEEIMTANWCLSNQYNISNLNSQKWMSVFYEHLREGHQSVRTIFDHFDLPVPDNVDELIEKPSRTTRGSRPASLDGWRRKIPFPLQESMQRVLDHFSISLYSKDSPWPQR